MNAKWMSAALMAATLTIGCGYSIKTATDYNPTVQLADYHTFSLMKGNPSGNALFDQRVAEDVRATLMSKGWKEEPEGQARAAVVIHTATKTKHTYETFYDGWGGWQWRWGGVGSSTTFVEDYRVGTLVVDIFDASSKQAIWRGWASDVVPSKPQDNVKATEEAVTRLFKDFPTAR